MNRHTLKIWFLILAGPFWRMSSALAADPPLPGTGSPDLFSAGFKMTGALILTIGGLLLFLYFLRRISVFRSGPAGGQGLIRVLSTRPLTPKTYITLVEVGGKVLTLGVAGENISCLDKATTESFYANIDQEPDRTPETGFTRRLNSLLGAKAKKPAGDSK